MQVFTVLSQWLAHSEDTTAGEGNTYGKENKIGHQLNFSLVDFHIGEILNSVHRIDKRWCFLESCMHPTSGEWNPKIVMWRVQNMDNAEKKLQQGVESGRTHKGEE